MFYTKIRVLYTKVPKKKLSFLSISFVVLFSFLSFEVIAQTTLRERIKRQIAELERQITELENLSNTCQLVQSILQVAESEAIDFSESIAPELREEDKKKLIALRKKIGKKCLSAKQKVENLFFKNVWTESSCFFFKNAYLDETPEEKRKRENCDNRKRCLESYWEEAHNRKPIADRIEEHKKIAAKEELFQAIYTERYYKELFPDTIKAIENNCEWLEQTASAAFGSGGPVRYQRDPIPCGRAKQTLRNEIRALSDNDKDHYEKNLKTWEKDIQEKLKKESKVIALLELEKSLRYCIDEGKKGYNKKNCKNFAHKPSTEDEYEVLINGCKTRAMFRCEQKSFFYTLYSKGVHVL